MAYIKTNRAFQVKPDDTPRAESRLDPDTKKLRAAMFRWLERSEYRGTQRLLAHFLTSMMRPDDSGLVRCYPGYKYISAGIKRDRITVYRNERAICGEVPGVPGMFTRRLAVPGETITRDGKTEWTFHKGHCSYIYTAKSLRFYEGTDPADRSAWRVLTGSGPVARDESGDEREAAQVNLPPAECLSTGVVETASDNDDLCAALTPAEREAEIAALWAEDRAIAARLKETREAMHRASGAALDAVRGGDAAAHDAAIAEHDRLKASVEILESDAAYNRQDLRALGVPVPGRLSDMIRLGAAAS